MLIAQRRKNRKINQVKRRRGRSIRQSVEFSTGSQAAKQAINAMSGANDVKFKITPTQLRKLGLGFDKMISELGPLSEDDIENIVDGDVDEVNDLYKNVAGWKEVNKILDDIFEAYS